MKKIHSILVSCVCVLLLFSLSACHTEPVYYEKSDVNRYVKAVFGPDFDLVEEVTHTGDDAPSYEYVYTDGRITFSVTCTSNHIWIDTPTIFYERAISDNYLFSAYQQYYSEILSLCNASGLEVRLQDPDVQNINVPYSSIIITDVSDLQKVSALIAKIDTLLALEYDYTKTSIGPKYNTDIVFYVYLPASDADSFDITVGSISLSHSASERWTEDAAFASLEYRYVNTAKSRDDVPITQELWNKYPATSLTLTEINGSPVEFPSLYTLHYDLESDTYWMNNLDPCQDFEEFPYDYANVGTFASLVEALGGQYQCDDWEATWSLGGIKWKAKLKNDKNNRYVDFLVARDGKKISLSAVTDEQRNGTTSGRMFSVEDLEQMLDVHFVLNQADMTYQIISNSSLSASR